MRSFPQSLQALAIAFLLVAVAPLASAGLFQTGVEYTAGLQPYRVAVGDFNVDGKVDLAVTNVSGTNVSILLGNGDGTFKTHVEYSAGTVLGLGGGRFGKLTNYAVGKAPVSVVLGDFNGDGFLDTATANSICKLPRKIFSQPGSSLISASPLTRMRTPV